MKENESSNSPEKKALETLLKNMAEGLKYYTIQELNEAIQEAIAKKDKLKPEIDFVINHVCQIYKINKRVLIKSKKRGEIQDARILTYVLLHIDLGLPVRYIGKKIFYRSHSTITEGIMVYRAMEPEKFKKDKEFISKYEESAKSLGKFIIDHNK